MSANRSEAGPEGAAREESAGDWLPNHAELCGVVMVMIGFVFVAASAFLGVDWVKFDGSLKPPIGQLDVGLAAGVTKEVGYMPAINWSLYGVIFLPLIILMGLLTFRNIETTLEAMASRGMVRHRDTLAPLTANEYLAHWRKSDTAWRILLALVFLLGGGFIAIDGWMSFNAPLSDPEMLRTVTLSHPVIEYDWSISCHFAQSNADCGVLRIFDMAGYLLVPGLSTVFGFMVAVVAIRFMAFVANYGGRKREWLIIADVSKKDEKKNNLLGWQVFEPFFSCLLYWAIAVLAGLWLMVVQNAFLRDEEARTIADFLIEDSNVILANLNIDVISQQIAAKGVTPVIGDAFQWLVGDPVADFFGNVQATVAIAVFGFVCSLSVFGSWLLLRSTAKRSMAATREHVSALAAAEQVTEKDIRQRLKRMKFWPVGWIGQAPLFGLVLLMLGSLFSYRLIMVPIAILAASALASVGYSLVDRLRRGRDKDPDDE